MRKIKEVIGRNFLGINDSTLREGEQFNGSYFTLRDQVEVLGYLYEIGVDTAEVGNPVVTAIAKDLETLVSIENRPNLMAHIRNCERDLNAAIETGVDGVHILCTADQSRFSQMGTTLEDHIGEMSRNVSRAQEHGLIVRVSVEHGLEDQFFDDALRILKVADGLQVDRVQIADTRGVIMPWEVEEIVGKLRKNISVPIGVHLHNDLGHATGNAIQALAAGANWIDTTLLGIGERTGITPLSALLTNLHKIDPQITEEYCISCLTLAEQSMARILGIDVPMNLITSETAFSHKAGIHVKALQNQGVSTYESIEPDLIGNQRVIVTGSRISGRTTQEDIEHLIR